jgi:hypothetical protein
MSNDKQVISKRKWTIEHITFNDGSTALSRINDGFNAFELMGLLELSKDDIINQMKGNVKPEVIKRKVIKRK